MILGILMTEQSMETKIAVLEAKVDHMMSHTKDLTLRVRANEKVVASVSLLGVIACTFIGAGYFAPKAEACSPPLDGREFTCPPWDDVVLRDPSYQPTTKEPTWDYSNGQMETAEFRWDAGTIIQRMRDWKSRQTRTPAEDSINKALEDMEFDYGSDDPTKQEVLLQLPSDGD